MLWAKLRNKIYFLLSVLPFITPNEIKISGAGLHRRLEVNLEAADAALLRWDITPDFYVDVYELKRLGFDFRVDDGETEFIEIEEPAHRSNFHQLSLNIKKKNSSIPFHLRYQPAIFSDTFNPYTSILVPGPELQFLHGDRELERVTEDPIEFIIPVGNRHHTKVVDFVTILAVILGTVILAREIILS